MAAYYIRPPNSIVKLADFFMKPDGGHTGPHRIITYTGKTYKTLQAEVDKLCAKHDEKWIP